MRRHDLEDQIVYGVAFIKAVSYVAIRGCNTRISHLCFNEIRRIDVERVSFQLVSLYAL